MSDEKESWLELTDDERSEKIYNIAKQETGLTNFNKYGIFYKLLKVLVIIVNIVYGTLIYLIKQANILEAVDLFLDLWGILVGVKRLEAVKAKRQFRCSSYSSGKIKAGTFINVEGTELRFKVLNDYNFNANQQFYIDVEAEFAGLEYNISANFDLRFSKVINGLDSVVIPVEDGYIIIAGSDKEDDEKYRARILAKWKSLTENNTGSKYQLIALSVPGVLDCKPIRAPRGGGSIDIILAIASGFDENEVIYNVSQALEKYEVVCRDMLIRKVNDKPIDLQIQYQGDYTESFIREKAELYFQKLKIGQKIISASSTDQSLYYFFLFSQKLEFDSLIIEPNINIEVSDYERAIPGNIEVVAA
jgi:hypothetical protein